MTPALAALLAPGFFHSDAVIVALVVGTLVATVAAVVGVFAVVRGQAFAGHAFGDIGTAGGAGAFLLGAGPFWGFLAGNLIGAGAIEAIGVRRARGRGLATGIVLGAAIGIAALLLYLASTAQSTTGATVSILFGSIFAVPSSLIPYVASLSAAVLGATLVLYRPLLLASVSPEIAAARGIPVRLLGVIYLAVLGVAVALTALTIGTILSTALLIGPAASALRLMKRPSSAMLLSAAIGVLVTWLGIVLAYDSYTWPPAGHSWPVSFFVVSLVFVAYLLCGLLAGFRRRRLALPRPEGAGAVAGVASRGVEG